MAATTTAGPQGRQNHVFSFANSCYQHRCRHANIAGFAEKPCANRSLSVTVPGNSHHGTTQTARITSHPSLTLASTSNSVRHVGPCSISPWIKAPRRLSPSIHSSPRKPSLIGLFVPECTHLMCPPTLTQQQRTPCAISPISLYKLTDVTGQSHLNLLYPAWILAFGNRKQVNMG
jgi:hypothetical protein